MLSNEQKEAIKVLGVYFIRLTLGAELHIREGGEADDDGIKTISDSMSSILLIAHSVIIENKIPDMKIFKPDEEFVRLEEISKVLQEARKKC